ncbi:MAG: phosphatidylserine decarboxylase family protein [Desulfonatronovibrionaceae bacterium]
MHKRRTGICPEGTAALAVCASATLVFALLEWALPALLGLIAFVFGLNFFRDPERVIPGEDGKAVSPADGKVVRLDTDTDPFTGEKRTVVCVFMNVFDVHVNRMPVAGTVQRFRYFPGRFINASLDKASKENERCVTQIRDEEGELWTVVQIAGLVARRIVVWAEEGDHLARGQRYGMIKFGSRLDLYMPSGYASAVKVGDKVLAGQSILGEKQK